LYYQWLWISKQRFLHFYLIGLLSLCIHFGLYSYPRTPSFPEITLAFHLARRSYECLFVHRYNETSKMHFLGYLLGISHYLVLPYVFVGRVSNYSSVFTCGLGVMNLLFQYEQYQHHKILAQMRSSKAIASSYTLPPARRWFRLILCPHYLAEILLYFTWAIIIQQQNEEVEIKITRVKRIISLGVKYRHWFLFVWVLTNLTVSSFNNYEWYKTRFPNQPIQTALIPHFV
jgi:3-oxo-5-alpha-steroid 4-dehydrogenase 3